MHNESMRRTPQEKKKLSLKKDRRNSYGESPHGARKSIPLNKRLRNRADRHYQESQLPAVPRQLDEADEVNNIDPMVFPKAPKGWKKVPDAPLGEVIRINQLQRELSQGRKSRSKAVQGALRP
jgi:hypothetical protein